MILLKNCSLLKKEGIEKRDLFIIDGLIRYKSDGSDIDESLDLEGFLVMPGACDLHVHLREPGYTKKETILSCTKSALKGGYTDIVSMPNTIPVPDNIDSVNYILSLYEKSALCNVYLSASLSKKEHGKELSDIIDINNYVYAYTDDGVGFNNLDLLLTGMEKVKKVGGIIFSHAEDNKHLFSREGEYLAVKRELELLKKTNTKYHFCHISTKESIEYIKKAKQEGVNVTCEVTPHHLFLDNTMILDNTNFKMNPPLMTKEDCNVLIDALKEGIISCISSDHAPHTEEEKKRPYLNAPNGVIGLETTIPLIYTKLVKTNIISKKLFLDILVNNPRKILNLSSVNLEDGEICNMTVLDITNFREYKKDEILSLSKNSPFIGWNLTGWPVFTFFRGKILYRRENE